MKTFIGIIVFALALAGCARISGSSSQPEDSTGAQAVLEDLGPAPELENDTWLNTEQPLRLANLRGKVVLLDMWTFG